jgi:hypothetical protein
VEEFWLMMNGRHLLAAVFSLLAGSAAIHAATISDSGTLPNINAIAEITFTLTAPSDVSAITFNVGTAGYPNAVLWIFDLGTTPMTQVAKNDPNPDTNAMVDVVTGCGVAGGGCQFPGADLPAGSYEVVLSAFDQHWCVANTNCNGVVYGNTGWSYNGMPGPFHGAPGPDFSFSVTIANDAALSKSGMSIDATPLQAFPLAVPEPASFSLLLLGGALAGLLKLRKA